MELQERLAKKTPRMTQDGHYFIKMCIEVPAPLYNEVKNSGFKYQYILRSGLDTLKGRTQTNNQIAELTKDLEHTQRNMETLQKRFIKVCTDNNIKNMGY